MDTQRHAVRKLDFSESNDFDEQLWPVNLALVLACGCVAGMIWAICDFQTPVWYENGFFWMFVLVASVVSFGGLALWRWRCRDSSSNHRRGNRGNSRPQSSKR